QHTSRRHLLGMLRTLAAPFGEPAPRPLPFCRGGWQTGAQGVRPVMEMAQHYALLAERMEKPPRAGKLDVTIQRRATDDRNVESRKQRIQPCGLTGEPAAHCLLPVTISKSRNAILDRRARH